MNRDSKGRYTRTSKVAAILIILSIGILFAHYTYTKAALANEIHADAPMETIGYVDSISVPTDTLPAKVEVLKAKLVDEMVACENPGHLLTWQDDNSSGTLPRKDKVSSGDLAYKISTVQRHYKTLYGTELSDREALMLALDTPKARELAIDAWIEIKGSINEWSCATPEMKRTVEDIRFLLQ